VTDRGRWVPLILAVAGVAAGVLAVGTLVATGNLTKLMSYWPAIITIGGTVSSVLAWGWSRSRKPGEASVEHVESAAEWLRTAVAIQWRAEVERRGLSAVTPIPLRWRQTPRPVTAMRSSRVFHLDEGTLADISNAIEHQDCTRLVVLGGPGAGKTTVGVLVLLSLVAEADKTDPVPLFLSAAAWDPDADTLNEFMLKSILQAYPGLSSRQVENHAISALVSGAYDRTWLFPILDGLDELSTEKRARALSVLRATDQPLMVTCRMEEYELLVRGSDLTMRADAVLEIEPVDVDMAAGYLLDGRPASSVRWQELVDRLVEPGAVVAQALSTPFILSLVREVYSVPQSTPQELGDTRRFPTAESIEAHLLDSYLQKAYGDAANHVVWLRTLAVYLKAHDTPNLSWWEMYRMSMNTRRVVRATAVASVGLIALGATLGIATAALLCLAFGVTALLGGRAARGRAIWGIAALDSFLVWIAMRSQGTAIATFWSAGTIVLLLLILYMLRATNVHAGYTRSPRKIHLRLPHELHTLALLLLSIIGIGAIGMAAVVPVFGWSAAPLAFFGAALAAAGAMYPIYSGTPVREEAGTVTPHESLSNDRAWATFFAVGFGACISTAALLVGSWVERTEATETSWPLTAVAFGGVATLAVLASLTAWGNYALTVGIMAIRKKLPISLMSFLDDAHARGLLRQVGPIYQFKHRLLIDRLCVNHPDSAREPGA
jgi:hypothetical protein